MSGIHKSKGKYILFFPADDVGPGLSINDMVLLMSQGCDLVSCTRYAYGGKRIGGSVKQYLLSKTGNTLFRLINGMSLTDATTGIKMIRKEVFKKIVLESSTGWAAAFEISVKAQILGMKLGEVPIISVDRLFGGKS